MCKLAMAKGMSHSLNMIHIYQFIFMHVSFRYANLKRQMFCLGFFCLVFVCMTNFTCWIIYKVASLGEKVIVLKGMEVDPSKVENGRFHCSLQATELLF